VSERRWLLLVQQQGRQPQSAARAERGSAAHAPAPRPIRTNFVPSRAEFEGVQHCMESGGSTQNESKFSVIFSRRQPSGRPDGFRLTPLRMCSCGRGLARACLLAVPWSVCLGRPTESRQRRQACAQRRGDRDSGRARRGFSRPPSGLKWPRGVSSFMVRAHACTRGTRWEASLSCQ
jgi:hypothetical protein